jgi:glycosyltransferase involved in cell wall biosynthesis
MSSHVCVVIGKECWRDGAGRWLSDGGFPLQMAAIGSLFDRMTLLVTERPRPGDGGLPLPAHAEIVLLRRPAGSDLRRKFEILKHLVHYTRVIRRHIGEADVVHVPPPGDIPLLGMILGLLLRKRLIVRYCGSWFVTARTTLTNRLTRTLMRRCAGGRNLMLATGEALEAPAARVSWIFSTALSSDELERTRPNLDRGLSDPPRLAYVGRLSSEKGVLNLIEAIALLDREGLRPLPEVRLIGDGPQRAELERRVHKLGYEKQILFRGQLDRESLSRELSEVDLCVQPSLTEGFSKAWLDALAHGAPVLATEAGAARSVLGDDGQRGWLVPPGDVRTLAAQLRRVLTEPVDWRALRSRGREFAESRTLERWAEQIRALCRQQWDVTFENGKLKA